MLITITTTSQTLTAILSDAQESQSSEATNGVGIYSGLLQNLGTVNVYAEFKANATTAESFQIKPNEIFQWSDQNLSDLNLISETSNNTNIRLLID